MCGRYYVDDGVEDALERIAGYREAVQAGDIVPSAAAPVMAAGGKDGRLTAGPMRWGYPVSFAGADDRTAGKLLINARAETVLTKRSFEKDVLYRRCIIPAAGFYEWNRSREKVTFTAENGGVLFMAGIYRLDRDGKHFVLITTAANDSMRPVHDRMPLILKEQQLQDWAADTDAARQMLRTVPPQLTRRQEYEQLHFDFLQ